MQLEYIMCKPTRLYAARVEDVPASASQHGFANAVQHVQMDSTTERTVSLEVYTTSPEHVKLVSCCWIRL